MSLPAGFYPVLHIFGVDNYRVSGNPLRESYNKYWWNDAPRDPNWPCFIEAVAMPRSQAPAHAMVGDLLDHWPRTVYYGGPVSRVLAPDYQRSFENWARDKGWVYETDIIPVQPNSAGMRHPRTDFVWYIATETRPPKRYRYIRKYGAAGFRWVDSSFDTMKYGNFHRLNPNVT